MFWLPKQVPKRSSFRWPNAAHGTGPWNDWNGSPVRLSVLHNAWSTGFPDGKSTDDRILIDQFANCGYLTENEIGWAELLPSHFFSAGESTRRLSS